ncbi:MAG TPA: hypothetical protein VM554_15470 [Acidisarcina sp.]|nr:hypothetical protein [Acidisarcina sp.]
MERLQAPVALEEQSERSGEADLLIGITSPVSFEKLYAASRAAFQGLASGTPSLRWVVAYPQESERPAENGAMQQEMPGLRFLPYVPSPEEPAVVASLATHASLAAVESIARSAGVKVCVIASHDLTAMDSSAIQSLANPIFGNQWDLCMPIYATGPLDDLLNKGILYPMTRALYGKRIRFPLAPDFGVSAEMLGTLAEGGATSRFAGQSTLVWPSVESVRIEGRVRQTYLGVRHEAQNEGLDLSTVLGGVLGSLFDEMDRNASIWQRIRGSQEVATTVSRAVKVNGGDTVDVRPLIDSFELGARNLQEVWSLILPPITLLELKRITRLAPDQFRIPDALWVRIVYDFALAHHLRNLSRSHVLGALTPLYLGWVASYVLELGDARSSVVESRLESLAQAYEAGKPYLLSRWRWPDRFNP